MYLISKFKNEYKLFLCIRISYKIFLKTIFFSYKLAEK